ncbi:MAG: carbamoyl-phosphate synthase large subunit [Armatimonadota bacterium]
MVSQKDVKKVLLLGPGPVEIGEGSELDNAVYRAYLTLKDKGIEVIALTSNPSSLIADKDGADILYIEPLTKESIISIADIEKPDAILPWYGGQTVLNLISSLDGEYKNLCIGTSFDNVYTSEDNGLFYVLMKSVDVPCVECKSTDVFEDGIRLIRETGFPAFIKPIMSSNGMGSSIVYNNEESVSKLAYAMEISPVKKACIQRGLFGWREFQACVISDSNGESIVLGITESIEPVGIHSGDSVQVFPVVSLSNSAIDDCVSYIKKSIKKLQICGVAEVKLMMEPLSGKVYIGSVAPRYSRTSSFVSKIIGISAADLSIDVLLGASIDELSKKCSINNTNAKSKWAIRTPVFDLETFNQTEKCLNTSMKSTGAKVAFGGCFLEAFQKSFMSTVISTRKRSKKSAAANAEIDEKHRDESIEKLRQNSSSVNMTINALLAGVAEDVVCDITTLPKWFITEIVKLYETNTNLKEKSLVTVSKDDFVNIKRIGYSDSCLAEILETQEEQVRLRRDILSIHPSYTNVSENSSLVSYSTYNNNENSISTSNKKTVVVIGSGACRIGNGSQFQNNTAQALSAVKEAGYYSVLIDNNPDSISIDDSICDKVFLEPLNIENVLEILRIINPEFVITQMGGMNAVNIGKELIKAGINVVGTNPDKISDAKSRNSISLQGNIKLADFVIVNSIEEAVKEAKKLGYPILVRPKYDYPGLLRDIVFDEADLKEFINDTLPASIESPVILDSFLENSVEVDVDAVCDGENVEICGFVEHIELAGVHSGDSASAFGVLTLDKNIVEEIKNQVKSIAINMGVSGPLNVQFGIKESDIYILDINLYASRTLPMVSKSTGISWAKVATKVILGEKLSDMTLIPSNKDLVAVKESVFPYVRFPGVDVVLGPKMRSTGEALGVGEDFGTAYLKAQISAGQMLPNSGKAFVSVSDADKSELTEVGSRLKNLGFDIVATRGTANTLIEAGIDVQVIPKIGDGRPDAIDFIKNGEISLIINTPSGKKPRQHEIYIRSVVVEHGIPIVTTLAGAKATLLGMERVKDEGLKVYRFR